MSLKMNTATPSHDGINSKFCSMKDNKSLTVLLSKNLIATSWLVSLSSALRTKPCLPLFKYANCNNDIRTRSWLGGERRAKKGNWSHTKLLAMLYLVWSTIGFGGACPGDSIFGARFSVVQLGRELVCGQRLKKINLNFAQFTAFYPQSPSKNYVDGMFNAHALGLTLIGGLQKSMRFPEFNDVKL